MVNRFQTFDGDANLFSGQNRDGDKFVLLRKFSDYESDSTFLFVENASNIHKTIQTSDGKDSIILTDAYGMDIKFIGTPDHINSLFQRVPDPLFERIEEQKEPEPIIEYVQTPGPKGEQGYAGADGVDGRDGTDGLLGEQGIPGHDGRDGIDGIDGKDGTDGIDGIDGVDGATGIQGEQGTQGVRGTQGEQGIQGEQGPQGEQGLQGIQGEQGTHGRQGLPGPQGAQGDQGLAGKDGHHGHDGKDGVDGQDGRDGIAGPKGEQGIQGEVGPSGEMGDTGDIGIASATYPLQIKEDGILSLDKKFIEQLSKAGGAGKITMQGGGGNLTAVMSDGTTINKDARHINFTGDGVTVTKGNRGKVDINITSADDGLALDGLTVVDGGEL